MIKNKIAIIGTGAYGTVLANVLADNNHDVLMYGIDEKQINDINEKKINSTFFNDILINNDIKASNDFKKVINGANFIIICVPTIVISKILDDINNFVNSDVHIINTSKGLDPISDGFLSDLITSKLKDNKFIKSYSGLYGPSLAKECIEKKPTCVMIANKDILIATKICKLFKNDYFYTMPCDDVIGCEIAAALKNTVAIACGIFSGSNYGDNAHASLITVGNMEIYRFASYFGAKIETFLNFATIGDLVLTASSKDSRNFSLGVNIAKANDAKKILSDYKITVEGVLTCKTAVNIANKFKISMPLFAMMYEILYNNEEPCKLMCGVFKKTID